uniref:ShKT domain-containing protein n=1 Tax=Rhabditophanes sp. KR3021 TaxID=114890 RepID=A0AC35U9H9_9BILA
MVNINLIGAILLVVFVSMSEAARRKPYRIGTAPPPLRSRPFPNNNRPEVAGNCITSAQCKQGFSCQNSMCVRIPVNTFRQWKLAQCRDTGKDCSKFTSLCHSSVYVDHLSTTCKRSCGLCKD